MDVNSILKTIELSYAVYKMTKKLVEHREDSLGTSPEREIVQRQTKSYSDWPDEQKSAHKPVSKRDTKKPQPKLRSKPKIRKIVSQIPRNSTSKTENQKILYERIKTEDPDQFFEHTRMTPLTFDMLLDVVGDELQKRSIRPAIEPECRLFLTLIFLSHAAPIGNIATMFGISYSAVRKIVYETCDVLVEFMTPLYLAPPTTAKWQRNAEEFERVWDLPNCVAAVDGKHIQINYQPHLQHGGIVIVAACDANYTFTAIDVGAYDNQSDGVGLFADGSFAKRLLDDSLNLPKSAPLPKSTILCNHYLVGDISMPLKMHLMKPYPAGMVDCKKRYYNKRLLGAKRVAENAFGILAARWRFLQGTMSIQPTNVEKIIRTTVVLHNFVKANDSRYCTPGMVDAGFDSEYIPGSWRQGVVPLPTARLRTTNNSARCVLMIRDNLADYLFQHKLSAE